jgi:hypothetical protein
MTGWSIEHSCELSENSQQMDRAVPRCCNAVMVGTIYNVDKAWLMDSIQ